MSWAEVGSRLQDLTQCMRCPTQLQLQGAAPNAAHPLSCLAAAHCLHACAHAAAQERERQRELELIKQQYLGAEKVKKKILKVSARPRRLHR